MTKKTKQTFESQPSVSLFVPFTPAPNTATGCQQQRLPTPARASAEHVGSSGGGGVGRGGGAGTSPAPRPRIDGQL
jgi:hypothetical protein